MLKNCIKHPLSLSFFLLLSLSGCAGLSTTSQPDVTPQVKKAYQQALASMKAGKYKRAIKQFKAITKTNTTLAGPHANLGILYIKLNSLEQAEQSLQKAIALNPINRVAHNYLGIVYRKLGRFDDAERSYLSAIKLDNNYKYAHLNLGILYDLYKSDLQKALKHYQSYQSMTNKPDKMVEKWIIDLKRRDTAITHSKEING